MTLLTTADDVRIADDVGDGGKSIDRARTAGAIGLIAGLVVGTVVGAVGGSLSWWSLLPAIGVAGWLAGHDLSERRLPGRGVAVVAAIGLCAALAGAGSVIEDGAHWGLGALAAGLPLLVIHLVAPGSMGFGDVKYAAALGGLLGAVGVGPTDRVLLAMVALTVAGVGAASSAIAMRRADVAFGPWLLVGSAGSLVFAALTRSPLP